MNLIISSSGHVNLVSDYVMGSAVCIGKRSCLINNHFYSLSRFLSAERAVPI